MASASCISDHCGHYFWHHITWKFGIYQRRVVFIHHYPYLYASNWFYLLTKWDRKGVHLPISIFSNSPEDKLPRYPQEIYWYALSVNTNEASSRDIRETMIEILREEGESRYSIELSKHHVMICFKQ